MVKKKASAGIRYEEKKALIDFDGTGPTVKKQCELIGLPRSSAYTKPKKHSPSQEEIDIKNAIDEIHYKEPSYGSRRVRNRLLDKNFNIGRAKVRRYMAEMGITAFYPGPNLSKRAKAAKVFPYLLRNIGITRPNQVWSIDITYVGTPSGFVYLTAIIDWYSKYIVGYTISNTLSTESVIRTVKKAVKRHGAPEIINSDQGSQFTSKEYISLIKSYKKTRISMDGKGRATDNIAIERFFRSYKWERLYLMYPETVAEVKSLTDEYMYTYNHNRGHQTHGYLTPYQVYYEKTKRNVA